MRNPRRKCETIYLFFEIFTELRCINLYNEHPKTIFSGDL